MKYLPPVLVEGEGKLEGRIVMAVDPRTAALIHRLFGWMWYRDPLTDPLYNEIEKLPSVLPLCEHLSDEGFIQEIHHDKDTPHLSEFLKGTIWEVEK